MLVREKRTGDPSVGHIRGQNPWLRAGDLLCRQVFDRGLGLENWYYPSSFQITKHPWWPDTQVVQFYNLHPNFFSYRAFPHLSQTKPLVWRLPDMWAFTGHCTYSGPCQRWQTGCGQCPLLTPLPRDTTGRLWRIKGSVYRRSRLTVVVTNQWMESLVSQSPLLGHLPRRRIPNGVNTHLYRPLDQIACRRALQLDPAAKVVLFAAAFTQDRTKGGAEARRVLGRLAAAGLEDLVLLVLGQGADTWGQEPGYRTVCLEQTASDRFLALAYGAADLLLHPAQVENFPNTILESMACGTPCVAFAVGGVGEVVKSGQTGHLGSPGDMESMVVGVRQLLENEPYRQTISRNSRQVVEAEYTLELQAQRFADLYQELTQMPFSPPAH